MMNTLFKLNRIAFNPLHKQVVPKLAPALAFRQYTAAAPTTLNGWASFGKGQPLVKTEFPLTTFGDDSIDMDVICCGICGTDLHTIDSGWGPTDYPVVVGHEIVGRVIRVGKNVTHLKVGDRAGVGCQCGACHQCTNCKDHKENLCDDHATWTFNDYWKNGDKTFGGFSDRWRGDKNFAFKIPDAIPSADASSILCGGVTTFAPMKRFGVGKGSKVAVLGLGGLGHFGVQWAKAMGAEVVAYDITADKEADAKALGCDDYVLVQDAQHAKVHNDSFTHILATKILNNSWDNYFTMMKKNGVFIVCDIPEVPLSGINALTLAAKQINVVGSFIGSPRDIEESLDFAAKHNIRTWANEFPMDKVNDAIEFVRQGNPRYRAVLMN
jgi:D-arabinose 1-dehydrogenase-like Zn-dependent alcohol dehydrogenase